MFRSRTLPLVLALAVSAAACGDDSGTEPEETPIERLAGSWSTTSFKYVPQADPSSDGVDIFALLGMGITSLTVQADGSFSGTLRLPDVEGTIPLGGSLTATETSINITFTGASAQAMQQVLGSAQLTVTYQLSENDNVLTWTSSDVTFDFTLQGNPEIPAILTVVLVRS